MIKGRDIVLLSNVDWDFLWQGNHEIASRLARAGNRVLYVENMGVRSPRRTEGRRVAARLAGWLQTARRQGVREVAPRLYVCPPLVLPPFGARWQRAINRRLLLPLIARSASKLGLRDPIVWAFLPTDTALDLIELLRTPRSVVVYSCLADFEQLAPRRERLREAEEALLRRSDLVFAPGQALIARCARFSQRVHGIDYGVDLDSFLPSEGGAGANGGQGARKGNAQLLGGESTRPVIGYVGGLHRHLDLRLAVEMARSRPQWSWVYVGPAQTRVDELAALPNVRLTGKVPHSSLPRLIDSFDVCTVPYALGPSSETVFPTKVIEYLAMGKPVVCTDLPELREFNAEHRVLITAPPRADAFLGAVEEAFASVGPEQRAARRSAAVARDWTAQLERMSALIDGASSGAGSGSPQVREGESEHPADRAGSQRIP